MSLTRDRPVSSNLKSLNLLLGNVCPHLKSRIGNTDPQERYWKMKLCVEILLARIRQEQQNKICGQQNAILFDKTIEEKGGMSNFH